MSTSSSTAVDDEHLQQLEASIDAFFVLIAGFLVFFMQCGFMLLSAGALSRKTVGNIMLQTLLDACFGCLGWYLCGNALANGKSFGGFLGTSEFALHGVPTLSKPVWFFQYAFAASTVTIVTGAVAERTKFIAYILYALFMTAWIYPCVAHWVWNEQGWLSAVGADPNLYGSGMLDFAGCSVVHLVGALSGFAGAFIEGPRVGRFDAQGRTQSLPGHSVPMTLMGVFILWFGWYGFNPGSVLGLTGGKIDVVIVCTVTTTLSGVAACISTMVVLSVLTYLTSGEVVFDVVGAGNGALAGLVGITSACAVVQPWAAVLIGAVSAFVFVSASFFMSHALKVDDPLDAVAMHGFCGVWGLIAAALFADRSLLMDAGFNLGSTTYGVLLGGDGKLLAAAATGIGAITAWTLFQMMLFFYALHKFGWLRVTPRQEREGMDCTYHGAIAYPEDVLEPLKAPHEIA